MNNLKDGLIGVVGCILTGITSDQINMWVSLICSVAIAFVTCGITIYRMIRDRNNDKEPTGEPKDEPKAKEHIHDETKGGK